VLCDTQRRLHGTEAVIPVPCCSGSDGSENLDTQLDNKYHEAKSNIEDELDKPNAEVDQSALREALTEMSEVGCQNHCCTLLA
jgi:hypothetical protein